MKSLVLLAALALNCYAEEVPIIGNVQSKCVITTDTTGVYGNPTADKLSTHAADGGVTPVVRYDVSQAHEMTPAYPKLTISHVEGVNKASLEIFNKREDVEYYEIGVFTKDWKPVNFVTSYTLIRLKYLGHMKFDVYIRDEDKDKAVYICSQSKLRSDAQSVTAVSSRICSKLSY